MSALLAAALLAVSPCHASQLHASVLQANGAAGTIVVSITLRNTGSACTLSGYPGLQLRSRARALPTRVQHGGLSVLNRRPRLVRLARGGRATLLVAYNDVPVGNETRCPTSVSLEILLPGAVRVAFQADACNHGLLRESPFLAGVVHAG